VSFSLQSISHLLCQQTMPRKQRAEVVEAKIEARGKVEDRKRCKRGKSGTTPVKGDTFSRAACEQAFRTWEEQGVDGSAHESVFCQLEAEVESLCKQLRKRQNLHPKLERIVEMQASFRLVAAAYLHQHNTQHGGREAGGSLKAGAKQTGLRRADACVKSAAKLHLCVADALADNVAVPGDLRKRLELASMEVAGWPKALAAAAGVAAVEGPAVVPTRGTTAAGRLRRLDAFMGSQISSEGLVVDLGFGRVPVTTVEMAQVLWKEKAGLHVLGVEADRGRARAAADAWQTCAPATAPSLSRAAGESRSWTSGTMRRSEQAALMQFAYGGFALPLEESQWQQVVAIRAMNVLRQYESMTEVGEAHATLLKQLRPGGLLFEGTSDLHGDAMTVYVFEAGSQVPRYIFFACSLRTQAKAGHKEFCPECFLEALPQTLYGRDTKGEAVHTFFECWRKACRLTAGGQRGVRWHFQEAAKELSTRLPATLGSVPLRRNIFRRGWLLWENPAYGIVRKANGKWDRVLPATECVPASSESIEEWAFHVPALEGVKSTKRQIIEIADVAVRDPNEDVFAVKNISLSVSMASRLGVVGASGVGMSAVRELLVGDLKPSSGMVWMHPQLQVAVVTEHTLLALAKHTEKTAAEYMVWRFASVDDNPASKQPAQEAEKRLRHFGLDFTATRLRLGALSKAQTARVVICAACWRNPQVIIFDNPSDYLDPDGLNALARGLQTFKGGAVILARDAEFVDTICTQKWILREEAIAGVGRELVKAGGGLVKTQIGHKVGGA